MNELLTPEEMKKIQREVYELDMGIQEYKQVLSERTAQAQHYKDTHPPKLDKPDSEGLWFYTRPYNDTIFLCVVWDFNGELRYKELCEISYDRRFFLCDTEETSCPINDKYCKGYNWQRAIVPE